MVDNEHLLAGLRALLEDVLEGAAAASNECDAMRANLDLYVHDELEGQDAAARQPGLWAHLQICAECRQQHDMLLSLLTAEARGDLSPLPPQPAVAAAPDAPPWHLALEPATGQRPSLLFVFLPAYLQDSLRRGRTSAGWRGAPGQPGSDTLLLSYLGETEAGEAMVQVYARPVAGEPEQCMFTVIAVSEPMPRVAWLVWGEQQLETALDADGVGQLGPVSLSLLDNAEACTFSLRLLS